jgi:hypothetical protein
VLRDAALAAVPGYPSARTLRTTSSIVVSLASAAASPASNITTIPSARAARSMAARPVRSKIRRGVSGRNAAMTARPRQPAARAAPDELPQPQPVQPELPHQRPVQHRCHQAVLHPHIVQPGLRRGGRVGVQHGQHQVLGRRRLHGDLRCLGITDFAYHDHVGIALRSDCEGRSDLRANLDLVVDPGAIGFAGDGSSWGGPTILQDSGWRSR